MVEARKLAHELSKSAPEIKNTKDLFVGFCCGYPGHWAFRCPARLPVGLRGCLAEPQQFRSTVVVCPEGDDTEPSQLTTGFGTAASGGVVKFPARPGSGVLFRRGNGAHFPITARPEYGTPTMAELVDGAL